MSSAQVRLMELLLEHEDLAKVESALEQEPELQTLLAQNREGCERLIEGLKREPTKSPDTLAYQRALFDGWVTEDEATSVAFYSLGSPQLLQRATEELVAWLTPHLATRLLDFGCGIGRVAEALPPTVQVEGVDLSANMIEAARRRCPRARFTQIEGRDLRVFADASFDIAIAVDSFPYVVDAGLEEALFSELHRVLAPQGKLAIFNYAYDDRAFVTPRGFELLRDERPFTVWNGRALLLAAL